METIRARKPEILEEIPTDASSVVEASAGTGKTFTLEHLIVELIVEEDISISNILVVTFTERATAELVERVRGILERLLEQDEDDIEDVSEPHWELDEERKRRLREALFSFDRAPIHTIHGFCHRILVEHAFANRRPFEQELVEFEELFDEAFHEALREDFTNGDVRSVLLESYVQQKSVDDLKEKLRAAVTSEDRIEPMGDFDEFAEQFGALGSRIPELGSMLEEMRQVFDDVDGDGAINGNKRGKAYRQLRGLEAAVDVFETGDLAAFWTTVLGECDADNPFGYLGNSSIFNKSHRNRFRETWSAQLEEFADLYFDPLPLVFDEFLDDMDGRLQAIKSDKGLFTYDDMLGYVWEAVQGSDDLVDTLRDEYEFALVDEFQDTDPVQWKIFNRIFVESGSANPCTLIGDPKQAIYGFRGADVRTYFEAVDRVLGSQEPVRLPDNYRSTPELIEAYNAIFDAGEESEFFRAGKNAYKEDVGAGLPDKRLVDEADEKTEPIVVTEVEAPGEDEDLKADGFKGAIFQSWSEEIRELLDDNAPGESLRIRDEENDDYEEVQPSDIFVLTRTRSQGDEFAAYLRDEGVPYAFYKREGLFETPEAGDWYEVLRAVERPGERSRRLKAWATPFFGVGLDEAADITEEVDESHALVRRLERWHRHGRAGRIGQLVHQILDGSGLLRRQVFEQHGERELTNYEHLGETFVDWAQHDDLSLSEIVIRLGRYLDGEAEPEGEEGDLQRLETEEQAVQIMTMHKAKGLSAPVVFVYGGYGRNDQPPYRYYDDEDDPVKYFGSKSNHDDPIEAYKQEENERLLYVAMTRPEGRLYLPYADEVDRDGSLERSNSPVGPLVERLDQVLDGDQPAGFRVENEKVDASPPDGEAGRVDEGPTEVDLNEVAADIDVSDEQMPEEETFGQLRADRRLFVESYKSVDDWFGSGGGETQNTETLALDERAEPTDDTSLDYEEIEGPPPGQTTGLCVHELLEDLDYATADQADDIDAWRELDSVAGLFDAIPARYGLEAHRGELEALVWQSLTSPVRAEGVELPSIAATTRQTMELEFWYPIPGDNAPTLEELVEGARPGEQRNGDGYLRGFIDLVFEWEGRLFVADWKTDLRTGDDAYSPTDVAEVVDERYNIQSTFYSTAAARLVARAVDDVEEFEERFGGFMYLFVRGMGDGGGDRSPGVYFQRPDFEELIGLEQETDELVGNKISAHRGLISAGRYDRWRA
jgi:exodeoxyribonuclease V beta subunit